MPSWHLSELWRFPVKSMQGERILGTHLSAWGLAGDRGYALVDEETGAPVSAKDVRRFPSILECRATYLRDPEAGAPLPPVAITLLSGTVVRSDDPSGDRVLSEAFGQSVRLVSVQWPEPPPVGHWRTEDAPVTGFFDGYPLSLITRATLDHLKTLSPRLQFDVRRFRMNCVIDGDGTGFVENQWLDQTWTIGQEAVIDVVSPDPRCVMTTVPQPDLRKDPGILRVLAQHNAVPVGPEGRLRPCAGVYAIPRASGRIEEGSALAPKA